LQSDQANWFAVYAKPRREQIAKDNLERQGFRCFLPMAVNPYQRRSRRSPRIEPLFPRYLFINAIPDQQSLGSVRSTIGVSNLVRFGMQLIQVPDYIINTIQKRCDPETGLVQLKPVAVEIGDKVKVFDGPFAGIEGIFRERKGKDRALLLISMLGTSSIVEVNAMLLKAT